MGKGALDFQFGRDAEDCKERQQLTMGSTTMFQAYSDVLTIKEVQKATPPVMKVAIEEGGGAS